MWLTQTALSSPALAEAVTQAKAYVHPETGDCMRKATVWTSPTTGQAARRYRASEHAYSPLGGRCVYCGYSLAD